MDEEKCQWCGNTGFNYIGEDGFCDRCPEELKLKYGKCKGTKNEN